MPQGQISNPQHLPRARYAVYCSVHRPDGLNLADLEKTACFIMEKNILYRCMILRGFDLMSFRMEMKAFVYEYLQISTKIPTKMSGGSPLFLSV